LETEAVESERAGAILRYIRNLAVARADELLPDRQLLERFATRQDQSAYTCLLKRHGPMVLSVCHSVLNDSHEAEDAFQATFVVLAQKAGSIHRQEAIAGWLFRVAHHIATKARAKAIRRRIWEGKLELRAARAWSLEQTARVFQVTAATIASWGKRLDDHGPHALLQSPGPVNRFPDYVRSVVQRLQALCPRLGKVKIARDFLAKNAESWHQPL
jgi:hypothetical protein